MLNYKMENVLLAISNWVIYMPMYKSYYADDYLTTLCLLFVGSMSFLSHLVENHKHGMPGIGFSRKMSYILNRCDVIACIFTLARFGYLSYFVSLNKEIYFNALLALICMIISEYDKYNIKLKSRYVYFHIMWHTLIFYSMDMFLEQYYLL